MFESVEVAAGGLSPEEFAAALECCEPVFCDPRAVLVWVAGSAPSAGGLLVLESLDASCLDNADRVTALGQWERYRSWVDAQLQRALVAVGGPAPAADDARDDWAREDVALALRLSSATAGVRLDVARAMHGRLARTGLALADGAITYPHARALVDAVKDFDADVARAVERAALDDGPEFETLTGFRRRLERVVIAVDPRTAYEQHADAVAGRKVEMWAQPFGMATVAATLTADEAITAMRALTSIATLAKTGGDDRPIDVRRADALTGLFDAALADPRLPVGQRSRPAVGVTIDLATLTGLAEHPGHLDGYGPIPPVLARRLAAGGDWHRLVTDPVTGALLDYGRRRYRPPADLAEFVITRDRTCRYPTCSRPARLSDIDHAEPYDQTGGGHGGSTSASNTGAACRRHHRQKTQRNTRLVSHPDGSTTWTTSSGHTTHQAAVDHCPEHTAKLTALRQSDPDPVERWDRKHEQAPEPEAAAASHERGEPRAAEQPETPNDPDPDTSSGNDPPPF